MSVVSDNDIKSTEMSKNPEATFVKLCIPDCPENIFQEQLNFIVNNIRRNGFEVECDENTKINRNRDFEKPLYEITLKILFREKSSQYLLKVLKFLVDHAKRIPDIPAQRCSVLLNHHALFEQRIECQPLYVPTQRVLFGNIWNNEFYDHWKVEYLRFLRGRKVDITTTFEFDKASPILVVITVELPVTVDGKQRVQVNKYQITVDSDSIQEMIVTEMSDQKIGRLYFVLKSPVVITREKRRVLEINCNPPERNENNSGRKVLTENSIFCIELDLPYLQKININGDTLIHKIISRFRSRWNIPIVLAPIYDVPINVTESSTTSCYYDWRPCSIDNPEYRSFLDATFPKPPFNPAQGRNKAGDKNNERRFAYTYMIEALLSRGSIVKDQLLLKKDAWISFLRIIMEHVNDDPEHNLCESALEDLLNYVDSKPRICDILSVFKKLCEERRRSGIDTQLTKEEWDEGYRKVRKIILTPTRKLFMAPEIIMSNRAINGKDHDGTRIIRVTFRDDNFRPVRQAAMESVKKVFLNYLDEGFNIMGRQFGYLASSNSQMRENGAYFMEKYNAKDFRGKPPPASSHKPKIITYRQELGRFEEIKSIPKAMARLGQCFTQAISCDGAAIGLKDYKMVHDVEGGESLSNKPFMFTDGIGMISRKLARKIAAEVGLADGFIPSAYQVRFRGFKGMLAVDPRIDETTDYFERLYQRGSLRSTGDRESDLEHWRGLCIFRPSQLKFHSSAGGKTKWPIELVKWSTSSLLTLNRPFISVLDHVSAMQSQQCHRRICNRIEELLDLQLDGFAKCIVNEEKCRSRLEDLPRRVSFAMLERRYGFTLSTEPFFRSLIKAAVESSMLKLLNKIQIQIPTSLGRSVFGVTDETGQLQYGQVFFRYTENINNRQPTAMMSKIKTGKVMITKFPATSKGDIRMFEAVDIPALHHLENVVVFSQYGPRSQPDEMAGSDLDGDEYAIIWDPLLFLEKNEEAFAYTTDKPDGDFEPHEMDKMMHEFYLQYMQQDNVGHIAVNHLYLSDQFGVDSVVCNNLAKKNAMALDFLKSGIPADALTNKWTKNEKTGIMEPPERSEQLPDFATSQFRASFQPAYTSSRLLGTLFRELRSISDVTVEAAEIKIDIALDKLLTYPESSLYEEFAITELKKYNGQLNSILDTFGVRSEAEVFSGCYRGIRNRRSEKEQDDMTLFNTESIIETQISNLFRNFREAFFQQFADPDEGPAYMNFTEPVEEWRSQEEKDVLRRMCKVPSKEMMAAAVAYYQVCYKAAMNERNPLLSFAWLAYDILNYVRGQNLLEKKDIPPPAKFPHLNIINDHRMRYVKNNKKKLDSYTSRLLKLENLEEQEVHALAIIYEYTSKYRKLKNCLFIVDEWAKHHGLINDGEGSSKSSPFKWYHLALMVIMVATRQMGCLLDERGETTAPALFDIIDLTDNPDAESSIKLSSTDSSRLTLSFFRFLSTREFRRLKSLSFAPLGLSSVLMRGEWLPFHTAAINTYYSLLLNMQFAELPVSDDLDKNSLCREGIPFVIQVPAHRYPEDYISSLRQNSKCSEVVGRVIPCYDNCQRILVSCRGTLQAINELRDFASIKLPRYQWQDKKSISNEIAGLCHYKIMGTNEKGPLVPFKPKKQPNRNFNRPRK